MGEDERQFLIAHVKPDFRWTHPGSGLCLPQAVQRDLVPLLVIL